MGNVEAEVLALEVSGEVVAPPALFDRIKADLSVIRKEYKEVPPVKARAEYLHNMLLLKMSKAGLSQVDEGDYHSWDCQNELYQALDILIIGEFVSLTYDGYYNVESVLLDYESLDEVLGSWVVGDLDGGDVCAAADGGGIIYIFDDGYGDCQEGCQDHDYWGFRVDADVIVTYLGSFSTMDDIPPPDWFANSTECTSHL